MNSEIITVSDILARLNQCTDGNQALEYVENISFNDTDSIMFKRLQSEFVAGLQGQSLFDWMSRLKVLVRKYVDKTLPGAHLGYNYDKHHSWHFLDMNRLRYQFEQRYRACSDMNLKVLLFERNEEYITEKLHEIIYSWCNDLREKKPFVPKQQLRTLYLDDPNCSVDKLWNRYLEQLEISPPGCGMESGSGSPYQKQILIVPQRVDGNADIVSENISDLLKYLDLWKSLNSDIVLILYLEPGTSGFIDHGHILLKRPDQNMDYETVTRADLIDFYCSEAGRNYVDKRFISEGETVPFKFAVEKLEYRGDGNDI